MIIDTNNNQDEIEKRKYATRGKRGGCKQSSFNFPTLKKIKESNYHRGANEYLCDNLTHLDMHIKYSETVNKHINE